LIILIVNLMWFVKLMSCMLNY